MEANIPFFSIIIPVYNAQNYIVRCIESCINQSFQRIEIIVVDDCGTDQSMSLIYNHIKNDNRIKTIKNPHNLGLFHARLQGFKVATGNYCLTVDADDFLDINICKTLFSILNQDLSIDMLHFNFKRFPISLLSIFAIHAPHSGYMPQENIQKFLVLSNTFQTMWGKAIKTSILKSIYQEASFIQPPLNALEDGIFSLLLSFKIKKYYGISKVGYFYQKNPNSITRNVSYLSFKKKCTDFRKVLDILQIFQNKYNDKKLIKQYRLKILSAFFLESRFFGQTTLLKVLKITNMRDRIPCPKYIFYSLPTFWASCLISMRLFYRWQTLVRLVVNILTFGKIKL